MGRNDPCPCGSGKKYKNCCIYKELEDNDDLIKVTSYGSEVYPKAELDKFSRFFIETTDDEKFEVKKAGKGYIVTDKVPPENTMPAKSFQTVQFNDIQRQKLFKRNPEYDYKDIGTHNYFDGIAEDGHFTWDRSDGSTSSKGTINKLYVRQTLGNYLLNIHLFPIKGEFKSIDEFLGTGLSIYTEESKLDFQSRDGKLFFEDCQVFAILSVIDRELLSFDEMLSTIPREYNLCFDIVIGKPIFILKVQEKGLKLSVINEKVTDVTNLEELKIIESRRDKCTHDII